MDFSRLKKLTFTRPDYNKFPALRLCLDVAQKGGTYPCVLNAANEEVVGAFLDGRLKFSRIYDIVECVVQKHHSIEDPNLTEIWKADRWARGEARSLILN
jgi:1-deoxy-D-xylulose-5-phosphate reductoisomerase